MAILERFSEKEAYYHLYQARQNAIREEKTRQILLEEAPFVRLPVERGDQSREESSFAFHYRGAITSLAAPQSGIEQVPHGIAEHV